MVVCSNDSHTWETQRMSNIIAVDDIADQHVVASHSQFSVVIIFPLLFCKQLIRALEV